MTLAQSKQAALQQYFGYDAFREGQELLIDGILSRRDVLGIMPTGAGKSMCFQLPALLMEGVTLVISPLISLMKDQVAALGQAGVRAAYINSSLTDAQTRKALSNAAAGMYRLVYVAPERLETPLFTGFAQSTPIAQVTIDEAHCVSQWGQDFRPSYTRIAAFIASLPRRPVVSAFTATATPKVRQDIVELLALRDPEQLVTGFDRANLRFEVRWPRDKMAELLDFLQARPDKSGIVYCATRKTVEDVCTQLQQAGYLASRYHAGLDNEERQHNQDAFLRDDVTIMAATNAFGMGIDKSNVSFVVHYNMPQNIEGYYQEAGRAGRDGMEADCVLFFSEQDVQTNTFLINHAKDAAYPDPETEALIKQRNRKRLEDMTLYCYSTACLRETILQYFGENVDADSPGCGNCSGCDHAGEAVDVTPDALLVLECVQRLDGRFGVKMVMDVLRGSKAASLQRSGGDKLHVYGGYTGPEKQLRALIMHMVQQGYLQRTADEYPLLQWGSRAKEITQDGGRVGMRAVEWAAADTASQQHTKQRKTGARQSAAQSGEKPQRTRTSDTKSATIYNTALFETLRTLRKEIADSQGVPAFVIFSDNTLADMCRKLPKNRGEMLHVSGVGAVKMMRYGKQFLAAIQAYV